jgi:hypothetical protein
MKIVRLIDPNCRPLLDEMVILTGNILRAAIAGGSYDGYHPG